MKILLITTHLEYGGISSYTVSLAKALAADGHKVWCASSGGVFTAQLKKNNIAHLTIPIRTKSELSPFLFLCCSRLAALIRQESIDIIHAQTRVAQVLAAALSRQTQVPFVTTCHGFYRMNIGRQLFPCWGEKVIAISEAVGKHLLLDFYVPQKKIAMIPNGIDVDMFRVSPQRNDENHPDRTVGIIARLSPIKGHVYLIEAMAQVVREFPDARLFIFGQGNIKYSLVNAAEKFKVIEKVLFLPAISNPAEVLREIDIFVMPSLDEGLGLSLLEAQASGIPVVASNVGGIPTVVRNEISGLLVPPRDAQALAGAIMRIMDDKKLAMRLGGRGRADVMEKFNVKFMAKKVEEVYAEVVKK